jgi:large subunit ribosomal protein L11
MAKKKKVEGHISLQVPAGAASPAPPIGPALGQRGVNIMEFCKKFNAMTQELEKNAPIPTQITVYADRSFDVEISTPPAAYFLKKKANVKKGSGNTGRGETVGQVTMDDCRDIAETKMKDLNAFDIDAAAKQIAGTARSMGIDVVGK